MNKDSIFFIGSVIIFAGLTLLGYRGHQQVMQDIARQPLLDADCNKAVVAGARYDINAIVGDLTPTHIEELRKRNPFSRYTVKETKPVFRVELPEPEKKPVGESVQEKKKEREQYIYRGVVVLGDRISYVIERERDTKTFFLNKGDKTRDIAILSTSDKQVVVSYNDDESIAVLPLTK